MLDKLAYMLGGRAAEEMVFHDPTTGAGNDIEKATALARAMVTQYGMTERLGAIKLGETNAEPFLGRDFGHTAQLLRGRRRDRRRGDQEAPRRPPTRRPSTSSRRTATSSTRWCSSCSTRRRSTRSEVAQVFEPLRRRPARPAWTGSPDRNPSAIPPVEIPQEIRDRAAANGAGRRRERRRDRLTPPGAGGDVHGDPTAPGRRSDRPSPAEPSA